MKKGIILITLLCSILISSRVKAMTMDGQLVEEVHLFASDWKYTTVYRTNGASAGGNYQTQSIYFDSNMYYHNTNADYIVLSWKSYFEVEDTITEHQYYGNSGSGMYTWTNYDTKVIQVIPRVQLIAQTGSWSTCELQNNLIVCPIFKNQTYTGLQFEAYMPQDDGVLDVSWYIGLNPWANTYRTNTNSIIQSQNENTQQILDSNTTYETNATQDYTNQTEEINNITIAEDQLLNNLDFNTTDMNITINPNASQFIWNIVDGLRSINGAIALLMTSLLSIGIIKLVLGR